MFLLVACGGKEKVGSTGLAEQCADGASCAGAGQEAAGGQGQARTLSATGAACSASQIRIDCPTEQGYSISSSRGTSTGAAEIHVVQMYEATSDHSFQKHTRGSVSVHVTRQGHHELVLGSYEAVDFTFDVAPGAFVDRVTLNGYYQHTVNGLPSSTVVVDETSHGSLSCYDAHGCAPLLAKPYTDFASCYRVTTIDIGDDPASCSAPTSDWSAFDFTYDRAETACGGGARYVRFDAKYNKWVGAELCSSDRYKLFLGETKDGTFHEIGDFAGDGQDHCELANPSFTMPNEDDIKSGSCPSCASQMGPWDRPGAVPVYARAKFGESFDLVTWPPYNLYTSLWYECGVSIGK